MIECCRIGCSEQAEWVIKYSDKPDDYIYSCTEHVGELLQEGAVNVVYEIE